MYSIKKISFLLMAFLAFRTGVFAQEDWPKDIPLQNGGKITIYQPQPESYTGNKLSSRAAVSVRKKAGDEPVFGAIWTEAILQTDKDNRTATLESVKVSDAKFPSVENENELESLKNTIESEIPKWNLEFSLDDIVATLQDQNGKGSDDLSNTPPAILYATTPSALITIDGEPILEQDDDLKMQRVTNSPFLIVKNPDNSKYYLYGGKFWYSSSSITKGWTPVSSLPARIKALDDNVKKQEQENKEASQQSNTTSTTKPAAKKPEPLSPPAIVISTKPAELIQTDGEPEYKTVEGTGLLYVSNSDNDIFKDINSQDNYIVVSGRWYKSSSLKNGAWAYVAPDNLPPDFSKIPEGSDKDVVLANVAGTDAAREAILDASIPQTAKVDRNTATTSVEYDGNPEFENIQGTNMRYATNTASSVIFENAKYYAVDNGVWFESDNANGPWRVSDQRPSEIDQIPANVPVYNTRYVYIYDATPDYIYMGYTPGYLGCYVYGPTVVYGTGWYYRPWHGRYYYPRPVTWGFGMHYNPWTGFNMNFGFSTGFFSFFNLSFGSRPWGGWHGGWWGPSSYRPPYRPPYWAGGRGGYRGGYYGNNRSHTVINNNITVINRRASNNLYRNNRAVVTRDLNRRPNQSLANRVPSSGNHTRPGRVPDQNNNVRPGNRLPASGGNNGIGNRLPDNGNTTVRPGRLPGQNDNTRPGAGNRLPDQNGAVRPGNRLPVTGNNGAGNRLPEPGRSREANNVLTDRSGNVYQQNGNGSFQRRDRGSWKPADNSNSSSLPQIQRDQQLRQRSEMRANNFDRGRTGGFTNRPSTPVQRPAPQQAPQSRQPVQRVSPSPSMHGGGRQSAPARPSGGGGSSSRRRG